MSERNNKLELLGSAPIPKALMALGVPIMIGMLINALYNLVDAYFVSGLGKSQGTGDTLLQTGHKGVAMNRFNLFVAMINANKHM